MQPTKKNKPKPYMSGNEFSAEQWEKIDAIIEKHLNKPGALIPVLDEVQEITGYLPEVVQRRIAFGLKLPLSQVYGVVTFYSFFTMVPRGDHQIKICLGTACHVRGGQRILNEVEKELYIVPGECTADRNFSLDIIRCVGACAAAPVLVVNKKIHKQVKAARINHLLNEYR